MKLASHVYSILSWGVIALGVVHMLTTAVLHGGTPAGRVWFFGAGIAMVLSGCLNLLHRAYGRIARGVRRVCLGNNVFMTVFAVVAGVITNAGPGEFATVIGLVGGTTVLSFLTARLEPSEARTPSAGNS